MVRPALFLLALASALTPAAAAFVSPADGPWYCGTGTEDIGALVIDGDSYVFSDLAEFTHDGHLSPFIDGLAYEVTSGILGEIHHVTHVMYGTDAGPEKLMLVEADGVTLVGTCHRPRKRG